MNYLAIFHTYSGVIKLEKELSKMKIQYESMPAPRKLSVDCGVALTFDTTNSINDIIESVSTQNVHKIYKVENGSYSIVFLND